VSSSHLTKTLARLSLFVPPHRAAVLDAAPAFRGLGGAAGGAASGSGSTTPLGRQVAVTRCKYTRAPVSVSTSGKTSALSSAAQAVQSASMSRGARKPSFRFAMSSHASPAASVTVRNARFADRRWICRGCRAGHQSASSVSVRERRDPSTPGRGRA
jgi:hypothetical protein